MSENFRRCPICDEFGFIGSQFADHRCKPIFECRLEWHADDPDAWMTVRALDTEEAAEKFAEQYDCDGGDYVIVSGRHRSDVIVQVRKPKDEDGRVEPPFERWSIEAETVPQYRAHKAE